MKIRTLNDLQRKVTKNLQVYNDFVRIYGCSLPEECELKYRAISSIDSVIPFCESINNILTSIINEDLSEDWKDTKVYYLMVRFLENMCAVDSNLVKKALEKIKSVETEEV